MSQVSLVIVGAGERGMTYAGFAEAFPERAKVVGVAEPREVYRERMAAAHDVPAEQVFADWREAAARPKFADAVVIATPDRMHTEPAAAFADLGYDILLEKPMATNEEECRQIVDAVYENDVLLAVCHVLRYTRYTQQLKEILDSGAIGDLVGIERFEPVGFWHMAHSFVRGNWRREENSGPMLLTKSCHDLDWLYYMMGGAQCETVSSIGSLKHFRPEAAPEGAGDRCLTCEVEATCPFSAKRIYLEPAKAGHTAWPVKVLTPNPTPETVRDALETGPYGRCVYKCDNDVVDHQVVLMNFEGGRTVSFTMMAFTEMGHRRTRIFGTRGELRGDGRFIDHYDFLTGETERIDTEAPAGSILGGHGGGDFHLMDRFVQAVSEQDPDLILSGPETSLASHRIVFGAERARKEQQVVKL
ncbi:MAG: Gfo/Idh/MocA family protein [Anaerolineae bacterium]